MGVFDFVRSGVRVTSGPDPVTSGSSQVTCTSCGAAQAGGHFCAHCGGAWPSAKRVCGGCAADFPAGAKFCAHCGAAAVQAR